MSIKINTDNSTFALNASRVEKFMTAKTRDQALHMGVLDRFKDFFRATDEKKSVQIAKIYDSITTSDSNAASPVVIAERFKRLRDLATDEAKPQFLIESQKDDGSNMWSYALSIGPDRIHQSPKMLDTYNESFESLSNYQKYFHGVDTVTAAPEAITDLNSSLQGVLHAMTADSTDTSAVLRALDQTVAILHPKLINPSDEEIRTRLASCLHARKMFREKNSYNLSSKESISCSWNYLNNSICRCMIFSKPTTTLPMVSMSQAGLPWR